MFNVKKEVKSTFNCSAKKFDELGTPFFKLYGQILADIANIQPNDTVLDIACGKGSATFPVAQKLNGMGSVCAIDISAEMIEECLLIKKKQNINNINFSVMDAENLQIEDSSTDKVICGFGLFFLPNIEKGINEIIRVLKPGGSLIFSSWNGEYRIHWLYELLAKYVADFKMVIREDENVINVNDFNSIPGLEKILHLSGLQKKSITEHIIPCYYNSDDEWIESRWNTAFRMHLAKMDEETYKLFVRDAKERLKDHKENDKVKIIMSAFITKALKPL